jgi:NADPH:quinone reductase-like Zn-dependent oxidoreductase
MSFPQNFAVIRTATSEASLLPAPIPDLADDYLLVRTVAVALNPTDWTTLDAPGDTGTIVGCDYAGFVEKVGSAVQRDWKVGDRVAGWAHGGESFRPAFNVGHGCRSQVLIKIQAMI